jgi:predicted enzyme related to lactoylglutathione lyase
MSIKNISLAWIVVKDFKSALKFYTEVVGLKLNEVNEQFGWAELSGHDGNGAILGIAQQTDMEMIKPGQNAVVTLTVQDINKAKSDLSKKGAKMVGDIVEIPGHVKMQMMVDHDGNHMQLVEVFNRNDYTQPRS